MAQDTTDRPSVLEPELSAVYLDVDHHLPDGAGWWGRFERLDALADAIVLEGGDADARAEFRALGARLVEACAHHPDPQFADYLQMRIRLVLEY